MTTRHRPTFAVVAAALVMLSTVAGVIALPAAAAGSTTVSVSPGEQSVSTQTTTTYQLVVDTPDNGVGAFEGQVTLTDGSVANITNVSIAGSPSFTTVDIADDNDSVYFDAAYLGNALTGTDAITIATVTVRSTANGKTGLNLSMKSLGDKDGGSYTVSDTNNGTLLSGAVIEYGSLSVNTTAGTAPMTVEASTTVENIGGSSGDVTVPLVVDGQQVDTREVTLNAGSSQTVTFTHTYQTPGAHNVTIGSLAPAEIDVNGRPVANLTSSKATANVSESVAFDASGSSDPDGDSLFYDWDLDGDGSYDDADGASLSEAFDTPGTHNVSVKVSDAQASDTATVTVTVQDITPPTPLLVVDADGDGVTDEMAELGSELALNGTASTDNVDVVEFGWAVYAPGTGESSPTATFTDSTATYTPSEVGNYTVTLGVRDAADNAAETNTTVEIVDTTKPVVRLDARSVAIVNVTTTFDASNSTDNGDIVEYRWDFDGDDVIDDTSTTPAAGYEYTQAGVDYTVSVTAVDQSNNTNTTAFDLTTSRAPAVEIATPADGAHTNNATVTVAYDTKNLDAGDVGALEYSLDGGSWQQTATPADGTVSFNSLSEGNHTVEFRLVDSSGARLLPEVSATTASVTFTVDRSTPTVTLESPAEGDVQYGTTVDVDVQDPHLETVTYQFDFANGTTSDNRTLTAPYEISTDGIPEGVTDVTVYATDEAGNLATTTLTYDFVSAPDIDSFGPNATIVNTTSPTVSATFSDDDVTGDIGVNVSAVTLTVNGQAVAIDSANVSSTSLSTVLSLSPSDLDDSTHTMTLTVVDEAGHVTNKTVQFDVDAQAPQTTLAANHTTRVGVNNPVAFTVGSTDAHPQTTTLTVSRNDSVILTEDVTTAVASGETTVMWDGTHTDGTPVDNGVYNVTVTSVDAVGNENETTVPVAVDNEKPNVDVTAVESGGTAATVPDGSLYVNGSVNLTAAASGTPGNASLVVFTVSADFTNYRTLVPATTEDGNWTGTLDESRLPDEGNYSVEVFAVDAANNFNRTGSGVTLQVDRTAPDLGATVTREDDTTARVNITASEQVVTSSLDVVVELPNGTTDSVSLSPSGERYTGTFALADEGGQYNVTVTGSDPAGNQASDDASAVIETVSTTNQTVTVKSNVTGVFVQFNTSADVQDTFVTLTASDAPLDPLTSDLVGASFLNGQLGQKLTANLTDATIGIPVNESNLPSGVTPDMVTIRRYNASQNTWVTMSTRVRNVTLADGTTDTYWTANVPHFSTYGAVVQDNNAPALSTSGPGGDLAYGETSATVTFEYGDELTGVDASSVTMFFNGTEVTDNDATTITSEVATYNATDLTPGETYTGRVRVVDNAGNAKNYTTQFTVVEDTEGPSINSVSPTNGTALPATTEAVTVTVEYADAFSGVDPANTTVRFNGTDYTSAATIGHTSLSFTAKNLTAGSTYTVYVTVADKAGNENVESFTFTVEASAAGSSGGGGGGGGGGSGDAALKMQAISVSDGVTVNVRDAAIGASGTAKLGGNMANAGISVDELGLTMLFDRSRYRVEMTTPTTGGTAGLKRSGVAPIATFDAALIGVEAKDLREIVFTISVDQSAIPDGASASDLVIYRKTDGGWTEVSTTVSGTTLTAEPDAFGKFAVGVKASASVSTETPTPTDAATPTATETASEAETDDQSSGDGNDGGNDGVSVKFPGFGFVHAILALLSVLAIRRRL